MIQVKINPEILDEVVQPYDVPILVHRWNKFSNGIHFFIDRNMAVVYGSNLLGIKDINLYLKQY